MGFCCGCYCHPCRCRFTPAGILSKYEYTVRSVCDNNATSTDRHIGMYVCKSGNIIGYNLLPCFCVRARRIATGF